MSTCYYAACEKCKEYFWIGQDGLSGFHFYSREPQCMEGIGPFLAKHVLCGKPPLIVSEHWIDAQDPGEQVTWKEVEWPLPKRDGDKDA